MKPVERKYESRSGATILLVNKGLLIAELFNCYPDDKDCSPVDCAPVNVCNPTDECNPDTECNPDSSCSPDEDCRPTSDCNPDDDKSCYPDISCFPER